MCWTFPLFFIGIGQQFPFALLGQHGVAIGRCVWTAGTCAWYVGLWNQPKLNLGKTRAFIYLAGSLALTVSLDIFQFKHFREFGYQSPTWLIAFDVLAGLALLSLFSKYSYAKRSIVSFALFPFFHRLISVACFPLVIERSDMLITIGEANQRLLAHANPYSASAIGAGRMLYLPGTWLSYLPAQWLDVDPRWIGVFWFACLLLLTTLNAIDLQPTRQDSSVIKTSPAPLLFLLWLTNPLLQYRHELYLDFFWLVLFFAFRDIAGSKTEKCYRLRTWIAGLLSAVTLQWGWITLPFVALFAAQPRTLAKAAVSVIVAIASMIGCLAVFRFIWGMEFTNAIFTLVGQLRGDLCFGFTPVLYHSSLGTGLHVAQIFVLLVMGLVGLLRSYGDRKWTGSQMANWAAFTLLTFVALNGFIEFYFYFAPLLIIALPRATNPNGLTNSPT